MTLMVMHHGRSRTRAGRQGVLAGFTAADVGTLSGLLAGYSAARVDVNLAISTAL